MCVAREAAGEGWVGGPMWLRRPRCGARSPRRRTAWSLGGELLAVCKRRPSRLLHHPACEVPIYKQRWRTLGGGDGAHDHRRAPRRRAQRGCLPPPTPLPRAARALAWRRAVLGSHTCDGGGAAARARRRREVGRAHGRVSHRKVASHARCRAGDRRDCHLAVSHVDLGWGDVDLGHAGDAAYPPVRATPPNPRPKTAYRPCLH